MAIDRDDKDERVLRLQRMIDEFELARRCRATTIEPRVGFQRFHMNQRAVIQPRHAQPLPPR